MVVKPPHFNDNKLNNNKHTFRSCAFRCVCEWCFESSLRLSCPQFMIWQSMKRSVSAIITIHLWSSHTHTTNSHDTRKLFLFGYWIICLIFICATEMASEWGLFWFCTKVDKRRLQVSVRWDVEIGLSQSVCSNEVDRIQDRVHNRPELKWHFKRRLAENTNKLIDVGPNLVEIRWRQRENRRKFVALHINKINSCRNTEIHQRHTYKRLWAIWVWMNNARKSLRICSWRTAAPRVHKQLEFMCWPTAVRDDITHHHLLNKNVYAQLLRRWNFSFSQIIFCCQGVHYIFHSFDFVCVCVFCTVKACFCPFSFNSHSVLSTMTLFLRLQKSPISLFYRFFFIIFIRAPTMIFMHVLFPTRIIGVFYTYHFA